MKDEHTPNYWRQVKVGQTIVLTDAQSVKDSLVFNSNADGMSWLVEKIDRLYSDKLGIEWYLFNCVGNDDLETMVMVKIVGETMDVRVYDEIDGFIPGNRKDMVENSLCWLFEDPGKPDFTYNELKFTEGLNPEMTGLAYEYKLKSFGQIIGEMTSTDTFLGKQLAVVNEYQYTGDDPGCLNPEILLTEIGGENGDEGGLIKMYIGSAINLEEIEVV